MTKTELLDLIEWELARLRVETEKLPTAELELTLAAVHQLRVYTEQGFFLPGEHNERIYELWKKDVPVSVIRAVYCSDPLFRKIEKARWERGAKRPPRPESVGK